MSDIKDARASIKDALEAGGVKAVLEPPQRITPNTVFVEPGTPYIEGLTDRTFGATTIGEPLMVRYDLSLVGKSITNANGLVALEDLIEDVVRALNGVADIETVGNPGVITLGDATYNAAVVTITANLIIEEET